MEMGVSNKSIGIRTYLKQIGKRNCITMCVCHVSLTVMSIALNIATEKGIRIDYYPLGIARWENFLTFAKTIENLFP